MTLFDYLQQQHNLILTQDELAEIIRIAAQELDNFWANRCQYCNSDRTRYTVAIHCDRCATTVETGGIE